MESSPGPASASSLKPWLDRYAAEMAAIRQRFEVTGDGLAAARQRTDLVDQIVTGLYAEICPSPA